MVGTLGRAENVFVTIVLFFQVSDKKHFMGMLSGRTVMFFTFYSTFYVLHSTFCSLHSALLSTSPYALLGAFAIEYL